MAPILFALNPRCLRIDFIAPDVISVLQCDSAAKGQVLSVAHPLEDIVPRTQESFPHVWWGMAIANARCTLRLCESVGSRVLHTMCAASSDMAGLELIDWTATDLEACSKVLTKLDSPEGILVVSADTLETVSLNKGLLIMPSHAHYMVAQFSADGHHWSNLEDKQKDIKGYSKPWKSRSL